MRQQEILEALAVRPFRPFRLFVADGAVYDVRHPDLVLAAPAYAVVGVPASAQSPPAIEKHVIIDMFHITRIEPLETPAPAGGNSH